MFVDTNVLVFASAPASPQHEQARGRLDFYAERESMCISRQILREFVSVITRPQVWAAAKTAAEATVVVEALSRRFQILEDGPHVWECFLELCRNFGFGGRQVHDANIVATMLANGQTLIVTYNAADFRRFASLIEVENPAAHRI